MDEMGMAFAVGFGPERIFIFRIAALVQKVVKLAFRGKGCQAAELAQLRYLLLKGRMTPACFEEAV